MSLRFQPLSDSFHGEVKRIITGRAVPVESAALIENVVADDELVEALYASEVWEENEIELLDFGGGERGITLPMVLQLDMKALKDVKVGRRKLGIAKARELFELCELKMKDEPYY